MLWPFQDTERAKLRERRHVIERDPSADEQLCLVAKTSPHDRREESIHVEQPREITSVLRERRPARDEPSPADARCIEIGLARRAPLLDEITIQIEERRAVLAHRHELHPRREPREPSHPEHAIIELRKDRQTLLRERR